MFVFRGPSLGYANWSNDSCPYQEIGTGSDAICCYPGNDQPICPNYNAPTAGGGGGGTPPAQSSSSTWTNVGAGGGAAIGEFLKHYLTPSSPTCPPGAVANPSGQCIPLTAMPVLPPTPWYSNPMMLLLLAGGGVVAWMALK